MATRIPVRMKTNVNKPNLNRISRFEFRRPGYGIRNESASSVNVALELLRCGCSTGEPCSSQRCGCNSGHLPCTFFCNCHGGSNCQNPYNTENQKQTDNEDEEDSSHEETDNEFLME